MSNFWGSYHNLQNAKELFQSELQKCMSPQSSTNKKGWEIKKLGDVAEIKGGSTPLKSDKSFWENGKFPWFTISDIRNQGRIIKETEQKVTKKALNKLTLFPINTILLCCTASVGEYAITKIPITSNQQFNGLTIKDNNILIPEYLFYYCATLKDKLLSLSGKTTIDFKSFFTFNSYSTYFRAAANCIAFRYAVGAGETVGNQLQGRAC